MNTAQLVQYLREEGARFRAKGDQLILTPPPGGISDSIRSEIAGRKKEILEFLEQERVGVRSPGGISRVARDKPLPMSFAQQRLWYLDQLQPESPAYNLAAAYYLSGSLDVDLLRRTLAEIVSRQESFRTNLGEMDGSPLQIIREPQAVVLPLIDLSGIPLPERAERQARLMKEESRRPFRLDRDSLIRHWVFKLEEEDHVLYLVAHHAVFDGPSFDIFLGEVAELYEAHAEGRSPNLAPLPVQGADFAAWERAQLLDGQLEPELSYWRDQLKGDLPVLQVPTDRPRPPTLTDRGAVERIHLDPDLAGALGGLARKTGSSLFMVLLAGFNALLHRYTGQQDIIIGAPINARFLPELEGVIGFFVNNLALRTDLSGDPGFLELLDRVRNTCLDAYENQRVPFERLVEELAPDRDLSRTPIFQAVFGFMEGSRQERAFAGLTARRIEVESGVSKMDLGLFGDNTSKGLRCVIEYNADLFDKETIRRFLGHYRNLLQAVVNEPDISISKVPLLTLQEQTQILSEWNRTELEYDRESGVQELFERQVEERPDSVAVVSAGEAITYRELDVLANRLARYLRGMGVDPGMLVGISLERSADMVVGILGILKAGGAYLPLDPEFPLERLEFMLADGAAAVLVTESSLLEGLPSHDRVVCVDVDRERIEAESGERLEGGGRGEDLAYVIYTSGSTGRPKGVQVPHRAVTNLLTSMARKPGLGSEDVFPALATLSFDMSVVELFLPLVVGARMLVVPREVGADGRALAELMEREGVTVMQATPATWRLLLEAGWKGEQGMKVLVGGEALPRDLAGELVERVGEVWNMYGPTETTVWSTCWRVEDPEHGILIGRPIGNTRVYVLDKYLEPVPPGVVGELYIGGEGVTEGYMNRPELTAEKFVVDPFHGSGNGRMYRTGDLARYRGDGELECMGRIDTQVKVRGFRIELGEIETLLARHEGVGRVVVGVWEERAGDQRLVAYYVPVRGEEPTPTELRRHLRAQLPEYMVPQHYTELAELPLTPTGKIDRKALPSPFELSRDLAAVKEPPRTSAEKLVARIWQEILGVPEVGLRDNFFDLGGHSLLSLRALTAVESETGKRLPARLMVFQTLEQIAAELDGTVS